MSKYQEETITEVKDIQAYPGLMEVRKKKILEKAKAKVEPSENGKK